VALSATNGRRYADFMEINGMYIHVKSICLGAGRAANYSNGGVALGQ
jgi:hypothetical protein